MIDFSGLRVKLLHPNAKLPTRSFDSAGYDLYCLHSHHIKSWATIPLGIATEIPHGYFGKILDRSGLAANFGLTVLGGVIDNDYRGEWKVILLNPGPPITVEKGSRVAQVVFMPYGDFSINQVSELSDTYRGSSGFGSTGV
ncbi:MAG: hypothetical protein A2Z77_00470 [Chloroflexi bacterium RBG_13_51_36]|nr:MAG: hypothetical protein A2Z77_00470 [Chloroflexi bacterium RBG_13_51_36]